MGDVVPSDFIPEPLKTTPSENSVEDGLITEKNVDADEPSSLAPKHNTPTPLISTENCKHVLEDGNESKEARLSSDKICESGTQEESDSDLFEVSAEELEERISRLERMHRELKMERLLLYKGFEENMEFLAEILHHFN